MWCQALWDRWPSVPDICVIDLVLEKVSSGRKELILWSTRFPSVVLGTAVSPGAHIANRFVCLPARTSQTQITWQTSSRTERVVLRLGGVP